STRRARAHRGRPGSRLSSWVGLRLAGIPGSRMSPSLFAPASPSLTRAQPTGRLMGGQYDGRVATHTIRLFGHPGPKRAAAPVSDVNGSLAQLVDAMYATMYEARGVGLAAPQIGVQQRFFVYDINDDTGPHVLLNPEIVEATGEWTYEEGCLSLPGLAFEIT